MQKKRAHAKDDDERMKDKSAEKKNERRIKVKEKRQAGEGYD